MEKYLVINGPNLNLLGEREPDVYGSMTLSDLNRLIQDFAVDLNVDVDCFQSNHEGKIIDYLHENRKSAYGVTINAGAFTHYSYAIRDAISACALPTVEVHISNIYEREAFRHLSVIEDVCCKQYVGLGTDGYLRALEYLHGRTTLMEIEEVLSKATNQKVVFEQSVALLKSRHTKYSWVGIYLVEGSYLVLHNYLGKPSPHERILIGKGICGAAVAEAASIVVPDVNADSRYLACSMETQSEIVVPIFADQKIIGEIDIDSDYLNAFHDDDEAMLEKIAGQIGAKLSAMQPT